MIKDIDRVGKKKSSLWKVDTLYNDLDTKRIYQLGAKEMAQPTIVQLHKHEELSSDLQTHVKSRHGVTHQEPQ